MKWVAADVEMYQKAAEYVDTVIVPLLPVSFGEDMKQNASMAEFIGILTSQLEKQFRGRIFLLPDFVYIKENEGSLNALKEWENTLLEKQFKHIFYVTSDSRWRQQEKELSGNVLWLPSLSLEHMQEQQKVAIVDDQVKQLLSLFTEKWEEE
ncbi:YpiF family protein [Mesobacillus jeotgali]|uniref:YpiF family protein n=1 Tax=Mesobacillus jeotgali TaxID=129985 RepID=UPI001786BAA4|nr:YpiF family protein [Mesobacillus jeotgali]UYZ20563.1 YpiF family protein [Mesobacillus jeotgali]